MPWSPISSSSASGNGVMTVNRPSPAPAANDLIVIFFGAAGSQSPTPPTGFLLGNASPATGGDPGGIHWSDFFYRVADGTEATTFVVNGTATAWNEIGCVVMRNSSMDTVTPIDTSAGAVDPTATSTPVAPSITTGRNGNAVLTCFLSAGGISGLTPPSGEVQLLFWGGDSVINWETQATAGPTGTKTETITGGAFFVQRYHDWTVSLNVQATGGGGAAVHFRRTLGRFGTRAGARQMVRTT